VPHTGNSRVCQAAEASSLDFAVVRMGAEHMPCCCCFCPFVIKLFVIQHLQLKSLNYNIIGTNYSQVYF
jgi:hypothetical protein